MKCDFCGKKFDKKDNKGDSFTYICPECAKVVPVALKSDGIEKINNLIKGEVKWKNN